MKIVRFALLLIANFAWAASSSFQAVPLASVSAHGVLPLVNGSVAVFGSASTNCLLVVNSFDTCDQAQAPLLSILSASGNQTASLSNTALGHGNSVILSAAADGSSNIWISGQTDSDDFPLLHPLYSNKADYATAAFVAKLDPNLNILFASFLGGQPTTLVPFAAGIALDSSGNAWVAGNTMDPNFVTTGSVFGTGSPSAAVFSPVVYTFVSKISADGSTLLASRLLGGNGSPCFGGSSCLGYVVYTTPSALAVDASGNLIVAGSSNAVNFPVTPNVYQTGGGAFVTHIASDGSQLLWSTELGVTEGTQRYINFSVAQSIALDAAGNVYVEGNAPESIATTAGALQPTVPGSSPGSYHPTGFAAKLSSDATSLLYATNLGGSTSTAGFDTTAIRGITPDPAGNAWITGTTSSPDFPGLNNPASISLDFALELNADASALQQVFQFVPSTTDVPPAFDSNGNLLLLGSAGNLFRLNPTTIAAVPSISALTNAAVPRATAGLASGEIITLYGVGLGPSSGIVASPDQNGLYPKQLAGVSIQFDEGGPLSIAAPLLFVGPGQINFQVPFSLTSPTTMTVTTPSGALPGVQLAATSSIGIFTVENQDGSINSASNPANAQAVVTLFVTGLGSPGIGFSDGSISTLADFAFPDVNVTVNGYTLPLFYAGTAPGEVDGLDQINVQLPAGLVNPMLQVTKTQPVTAQSNSVTVYTQ